MLMIFGGYLKAMYPEGIEVVADSPLEAITALENFPGFQLEDDVQHRVFLPDFNSIGALRSKTEEKILRIEPVLEGGGGSAKTMAWIQIVVGAVLISTGYGATAGSWLVKSGMSAAMMMAGGMMVLGGALQLLMPAPTLDTSSKDPKSNYLPANRNTTQIGTPVPLLFGTRRVWPHFLSYNVSATNLNAFPVTAPVGGSSGSGNQDYEITYDDWPNPGGA